MPSNVDGSRAHDESAGVGRFMYRAFELLSNVWQASRRAQALPPRRELRRAMTTDNPIEPELIVAAIDAAEADRRRHRRGGSHWIGWLRRLP
jgi:hypothetical protein